MNTENLLILLVFLAYIVGVLVLGILAHKLLSRGNFVTGYFLGHRGLGSWVLALSMAATAVSGGSFTGFPAKIYTNGWIMALWIASYMVVALTVMLFLGKRINQAARISGAVTVPDVLRDRFSSPALGIVSTLMILVFVTFNLVAQFKAGGVLMQETLGLSRGAVEIPITGWEVQQGYLWGLICFAVTVVGYTAYGGFWAVTWNDVLQGIVMLVGVLLLAFLAIRNVPPTSDGLTGLAAATEHLKGIEPTTPEEPEGSLVFGPGPKLFLPLTAAIAFFMMWSFNSPGQPGYMVRLMSYKDGASFRKALVMLSVYYLLTYLALIVIFICARAYFPTEYLAGDDDPTRQPDNIMAAMAREMPKTEGFLGWPLVAGILLAAPFSAIMSTVAAYLLLIASALVRDIYQRSINNNVSDRTVKRLSYAVTAMIGLIVMIGALNPPTYLQDIIVFTGSGAGCAFLVPMAFALYWRRSTRWGVLSGMLGGGLMVFGLYSLGWVDNFTRDDPTLPIRQALSWVPDFGRVRGDRFSPLTPLGLNPMMWGYAASILLCYGVSKLGRPNPEQVAKYFPR